MGFFRMDFSLRNHTLGNTASKRPAFGFSGGAIGITIDFPIITPN
jgi:hypothetical protein